MPRPFSIMWSLTQDVRLGAPKGHIESPTLAGELLDNRANKVLNKVREKRPHEDKDPIFWF